MYKYWSMLSHFCGWPLQRITSATGFNAFRWQLPEGDTHACGTHTLHFVDGLCWIEAIAQILPYLVESELCT